MRLPVVCNLILSSPFLPLKRFCGNGFFRRPSLFQATIHQFFLDSISFCPFCRCECFSVYGQKRVFASISSLLFIGCPSAIIGGISLVVIYPVASQFVRISIRKRPIPKLRKIVFPPWYSRNLYLAHGLSLFQVHLFLLHKHIYNAKSFYIVRLFAVLVFHIQ